MRLLRVEGSAGELPERVPHSLAIQALQGVVARSGDPAFALRAASRVQTGELDVLEYVARTSQNVKEAVERAARYARLLHDSAWARIEEERGVFVWRFGIEDPVPWPPACAEYMTGLITMAMANMTAGRARPAEVWFRHQAPPYVAAYREMFECPIRFGASSDAVVLDQATLALPLPGADPGLQAVLERQAEHLVDQLPQRQTFRHKVLAEINEALLAGDTRVSVVAHKLGVSPRTLRRRLQEEKTGYAQLLDEARREVALAELRAQRRSISEIATQLGFTRIPSFYRAFKRWTGTTPAEYRLNGS